MLTFPPGLAPPAVATAARWIEGPAPDVLPDEFEVITRAVEVRAREFAFGRACARHALAGLGLADAARMPIPCRSDRTPHFPDGIVGSVSHTRDLAAAVAAPDTHVRALGLDVEKLRPLEPAIVPMVTTAAERARGAADPGETVRWFGAKEAVYKCWYTAGGQRILEFEEVEVDLRPDGTLVVLRQPPPVVPMIGRWAIAHDHHWALVVALRTR